MTLRAKAILAAIALAVVGLEYPVGVAFQLNPSVRSPLQFDAGLSLGLMIAAGLLFFSWLFDARTEARAGGPPLRWNGFWAVAGWLIPIANIVIPVLVMNELDRRSSGRSGAFVTWAVAWVLFQASYPGIFLVGNLVGLSPWPTVLVMALLHVAAAAAAAVLVLSVTRRLREATRLPLGGTAR